MDTEAGFACSNHLTCWYRPVRDTCTSSLPLREPVSVFIWTLEYSFKTVLWRRSCFSTQPWDFALQTVLVSKCGFKTVSILDWSVFVSMYRFYNLDFNIWIVHFYLTTADETGLQHVKTLFWMYNISFCLSYDCLDTDSFSHTCLQTHVFYQQ